MSKVLAIAVEAFVNRAGLSPNAIGDLKKYEGYLEESRAILAFCDAARTEYGFTLQSIGKAVNRNHSTIHRNMKVNPDGHHIDVYFNLAKSCIQGAVDSL